MKKMKNVLFSVVTLLASVGVHASNRCRNDFSVLDQNSVSAIAANICTLDALKEIERLPLTLKTSSTFTHDFTVYKQDDIITVQGVCTNAVDMFARQIKEGRRFKIEFDLTKFRTQANPVFVGTLGEGFLGATTIKAVFKDYSSYDPTCSGSSSHQRVLEAIVAGDGVFDILKRERSNLSARNIEQSWGDSWSQSKLSLDFKVTQFTGRSLRLATTLDRYSNLLVKSGNYLFKEEGGQEFTDSYKKANNIFLKKRNSYQGCSVFIQESELTVPYMMSSMECSELGYKTTSFLRVKR